MRIIRNAFIFVALLSFGCSSHATLPRVKMEYSSSEDLACSLPPASPIKEEWKAELLSRQPEFVKICETEGPPASRSYGGNFRQTISFAGDHSAAHALQRSLGVISQD